MNYYECENEKSAHALQEMLLKVDIVAKVEQDFRGKWCLVTDEVGKGYVEAVAYSTNNKFLF